METTILNSSGSRSLDLAAVRALSRCMFERSVNVDSSVDVWVRLIYDYDLHDDPERLGAKKIAALSASKGNVSARYHLGLLLLRTAKTIEDRVAAISMINSAAEMGHPHAQFEMGRHHETGDVFVGNLDEAMRWYQKSAAQGDPFAKQRLALRILSK